MAGIFLAASKLNSPSYRVTSRSDLRRGVNNFTYRDRYKFSCLDGYSSMKIGSHLLFIDIIYIVECH